MDLVKSENAYQIAKAMENPNKAKIMEAAIKEITFDDLLKKTDLQNGHAHSAIMDLIEIGLMKREIVGGVYRFTTNNKKLNKARTAINKFTKS